LTLPWIGAARVIELLAIGMGRLVFTSSFDLLTGTVQGERIRRRLGACCSNKAILAGFSPDTELNQIPLCTFA
jgi:hypothetical protein